MSGGAPEQADALIGLTIGSYVVRSKIAEGGMGAVYKADSAELGQSKVVKVLLGEFANHPVIRERFLREAKAAARLKGKPHIVKIDDIGTLPGGQQFMTMEYLHGRTLEAHMRQCGRLTPHHAFHIVVQIARGLHELHHAGIVHRDLKPGNVFLTTTDDNPYYVVLIDLGIAHDAASYETQGFKTQTGSVMGTPGYMAPEQYGDASSVTPAADLYALGVILWEMLTGSLPWGFEDSRVYYFKQRTETPVLPQGVLMPDAWRDVLLSTLSPHVEARPQTIYAFLAGLASALPGDERMTVPSGAQMMATFAKSMLRNAGADNETVRARGGERVAPMMWSPDRSTHIPSNITPTGPSPRDAATHTMPPTANERPVAGAVPNESRPTTLSASSGVAQGPPPSRRMPLVALGVAVALVGAGVTFVVARSRSGHETVQAGASGSGSEPTATVTEPVTPPAAPAAPVGTTPVAAAGTGSAPASPAATVDSGAPSQPDVRDAGAPAATAPAVAGGSASTVHHAAGSASGTKAGTSKSTTKSAHGSAAAHGTFDPDAVEE